jgi:hypothetical protein
MEILVKIVKIGQLQMAVESRESINDAGFFRSKHTYIIAEQKQLHMVSAGNYPHKKLTITKRSQSLLSPDGFHLHERLTVRPFFNFKFKFD